MVESELELYNYIKEANPEYIQQIQEELNMKNRQEFLNQHPYSVWQGKNGKWYTKIPDGKGGKSLKKRNTKKEIEQIVVDYWRQQEENPTIEEVFREWNTRRLELKSIAHATYSREQRRFERYYCSIRDKKIKSISPEYLEEFLEETLVKYELSSKEFSNLRSITRGFLKRAKKRKFIEWNVEDVFMEMDLTEREFKKIVKEDCEEVFNEEETEMMINYLVKNLDLRNLALLLMFLTGVRVGEVVALKHTDFDDNLFRIRRTETKYTDEETKKDVYKVSDFPKTDAGLRSPMIPTDYAWVVKKLKAQNPFGEYIFYENGKRLTTNCIRQRCYRVCKKVGIYPRSPHKIRKTYCSILIENNVDKRLILDVVGHTDISCTEKHYHRNRKTMQKKLEILSSIPEFQTK